MTTAVQTTTTVGSLLRDEKNKSMLRSLLGLETSREDEKKLVRFIATAFQTYIKTPALVECDPLSVVLAIKDVAGWDLALDGALGEAYLVPYAESTKDAKGNWHKTKKAQAQIGYRGVIKLALRSGQVAKITADVVWKWDGCELIRGSEERIVHTPHEPSGDRTIANLIGAYAVATYRDRTTKMAWMWRADVERSRDRSKSYQSAIKYGNDKSPWITDPGAMAITKVVHRLGKQLELSTRDLRALHSIDMDEGINEEPREVVAEDVQTSDALDSMLAMAVPEPAIELEAAEPDISGATVKAASDPLGGGKLSSGRAAVKRQEPINELAPGGELEPEPGMRG